MKPNFLFIGPDKTGSSWLYEILRAHRECYVPQVKDIYFFDRYYERGMPWYERFFVDAPSSAIAIGELSHDYLFSPTAASRIAANLPSVRLLTSLRDPAERTFSQYLYFIRTGWTREPFDLALRRFPELIDNSRYCTHLSAYYDRFPPEQLRVLLFEDLKTSPERYAVDVFDFLGVSFQDDIDFDRVVLPASRPRSAAAARLAKAGAELARDLGFARVVGVVKRSSPARLLYRQYGRDERPRLTADQRARLWDIFEPEVRGLEKLTGLDLKRWSPTDGVPA